MLADLFSILLTHLITGSDVLNVKLYRTLGNGILERSVAGQGESSDIRDSCYSSCYLRIYSQYRA